MAAAATSGVMYPAMASGTATTLYSREKAIFWRTSVCYRRAVRHASPTGKSAAP